MRPVLVVIWTAAILLLALPGTAVAHGGNPNYRSVINELLPPNPGVEFEVIDYDADIRITAQPGTTVDLAGYDGEPYARILDDGRVEVNRRSRALYLNSDRYGTAEIPDDVDPEAEPEWEEIRSDGVFQYHDHRSHWMSPEDPEDVRDKTERTKVFDYEIPIVVDGTESTLLGTLWWVGPSQGSKLPFILAGLAVLLAAGAATLVVRRRRAGDQEPRTDDSTEAW